MLAPPPLSSVQTVDPGLRCAGGSAGVLRRSGVAALGASLLPIVSSCTRGSGVTTSVAPPPTGSVAATATPADWRGLADSLDGTLYRPATPGYRVASMLFDPRFDGSHPLAVARCALPSDVQRSIAFAREHSIPIASRSGGHSYGGYSTGPGIVIDVSGMASVRLSPGSVRVGAGTRLIDLYAALGPAGVGARRHVSDRRDRRPHPRRRPGRDRSGARPHLRHPGRGRRRDGGRQPQAVLAPARAGPVLGQQGRRRRQFRGGDGVHVSHRADRPCGRLHAGLAVGGRGGCRGRVAAMGALGARRGVVQLSPPVPERWWAGRLGERRLHRPDDRSDAAAGRADACARLVAVGETSRR